MLKSGAHPKMNRPDHNSGQKLNGVGIDKKPERSINKFSYQSGPACAKGVKEMKLPSGRGRLGQKALGTGGNTCAQPTRLFDQKGDAYRKPG